MNISLQLSIIIIGDDMENKKFIVAIVILSILLLAALGFIGYDKFLKKDDESEIADLALNIILNVIYRDGNKEISEKAYYVLEKIVRHYCLVK